MKNYNQLVVGLFAIALMSAVSVSRTTHAGFLNKIQSQVKTELAKKQNKPANQAAPTGSPAGTVAAAPQGSPAAISAGKVPTTPPGHYSCDSSRMLGICYNFSGKKNLENSSRQGNEIACKMLQGKLGTGQSCPQDRAVGYCTILKGTPQEYILAYYEGVYNQGKHKVDRKWAETDCKTKSSLHAHGAGEWNAF